MRDDVAADMIEEFLPKPPRNTETCLALVLAGIKPHVMIRVHDKPMEVISMPFVQDGVSVRGGGCGIGVLIRKPNDPTTVREWSVPARVVRAALRVARFKRIEVAS